MNSTVTAGLIILVIAFALLVSGSYLRSTEGFTNWNTNIMGGFCGVDLPSCPHPLKCINAYCQDPKQPQIPESSGLPVLPEGYIRL